MVNLPQRTRAITGQQGVQFNPSGASSHFYSQLASLTRNVAADMTQKANNIYSSELEIDIRRNTRDIYKRNSNNPEQLKKELDSYREGILSKAPESLRPNLNLTYEKLTHQYVDDAQAAFNKELSQKQSLETRSLNEQINQDIRFAANKLFSFDENSSEEENRLQHLTAIDNISRNLIALEENMSKVDKQGNLIYTPNQIVSAISNAKENILQEGALAYFESKSDKFTAYNDWLEGKVKIEMPEGTINVREALDPKVRVAIDNKLLKKYRDDLFLKKQQQQGIEAKREVFSSLKDFTMALKGEKLLDPTNKGDKKLINENYDKLLEDGVEDKHQLGNTISVITGIIPNQYKRDLSASLYNGDPLQKIQAAESIVELIDDKASLQNQFSSDQKALAFAISNRNELGLPAEQIIEFTENDIRQNKSQDRIIRETKFNIEYGKAENSQKTLEAINDITAKIKDKSGFIFEAEAPDAMGLDYVRVVKDFYLNEGLEIEDAQKAARSKVESEWGITNVGKKRYQKYAPEQFYSVPNMNPRWINNQVMSEVRKYTLEDVSPSDLKDQVSLNVIPSTIASGKPKYHIMRKNEYGLIDYVRNNKNENIVFQPDVTKTKEYKEEQKQLSEAMITPQTTQEFYQEQERIFKEKLNPFDLSQGFGGI